MLGLKIDSNSVKERVMWDSAVGETAGSGILCGVQADVMTLATNINGGGNILVGGQPEARFLHHSSTNLSPLSTPN